MIFIFDIHWRSVRGDSSGFNIQLISNSNRKIWVDKNKINFIYIDRFLFNHYFLINIV